MPDADSVYDLCIRRLSDIKLTQGPLCVSSTLKKRPKLAEFILGYQIDSLDDLEQDIKALTVSPEYDKLNSEGK